METCWLTCPSRPSIQMRALHFQSSCFIHTSTWARIGKTTSQLEGSAAWGTATCVEIHLAGSSGKPNEAVKRQGRRRLQASTV
eukprot:1160599-Pelagomonas_calceolata.AAC.3